MHYGRELSFVRCVGNVMKAEARKTDCLLKIEDSSVGQLQISLFSNKRKESDPPDMHFERIVKLIEEGNIR